MDDERRVRVTLPAVRACERGLRGLVDVLDPDDVGLSEASDVWAAFDRIERLAANAKTLLAATVEAGGGWRRSGARSGAEHLARLGGTSTSQARRSLETSKQLTRLPVVAAAARSGVLSAVQVDAVASAAIADPAAQARLVEVAGNTNVTELREECLRTRAGADPDRDATHRRIHRNRYARSFTDAEGAWNLVARGTVDDGARFESAVAPIIDELFNRSRDESRREPREVYAFDALVALADRDESATPTGKKKRRSEKPRYFGLLHASVEALTRGAIEGEETCEIVGVGPVPVRIARELLGESILKVVITNGVDVVNVTHLGRGPTAAQRVALLWSKPKCANVECSSMFVQLDHREPWAKTKHTKLDELDPFCPHDHDLKTYQGWSLVEGKGRRAFVPPDDPRHPRNRPPPSPGRLYTTDAADATPCV
jgi:hypothetical protein